MDERFGEESRLRAEGESLGLELKPDYEAIRSRTLSFPEMGQQSADFKAIDAFIKELGKHE